MNKTTETWTIEQYRQHQTQQATKPARKSGRNRGSKAPRQYCALCGDLVYASPSDGRSSGWHLDTWQMERKPRLVLVHLDCYFAKMDECIHGEWSI